MMMMTFAFEKKVVLATIKICIVINGTPCVKIIFYYCLIMKISSTFNSKRQKQGCTWSINMSVKVIGAEGCRCLGDALRDIDAKSLIRGHFVLMEAETVTNANLSYFLEEHK